MADHQLGVITIDVVVDADVDEDGNLFVDAGSPPKLMLNIELPWDADQNLRRGAQLLRNALRALEAQIAEADNG